MAEEQKLFSKNAKDMKGSYFPIKVLLYGELGTGKTLLASTFPNPYFIDTENGTVTLRGLDVNIETILHEEDNKVPAFTRLKQAFVYIKSLDLDENSTVVIDSLTLVNDQIVKFYQKKLGEDGSFKLWRDVLDSMIQVASFLLTLKCNVVVTAHTDLQHESEGIIAKRAPKFTGQAQDRIPPLLDEVWYLKIDNKGNRIIQTDGDNKTIAKSRLNRSRILPKEVMWQYDNNKPHFNPIIELLKEAEKGK